MVFIKVLTEMKGNLWLERAAYYCLELLQTMTQFFVITQPPLICWCRDNKFDTHESYIVNRSLLKEQDLSFKLERRFLLSLGLMALLYAHPNGFCWNWSFPLVQILRKQVTRFRRQLGRSYCFSWVSARGALQSSHQSLLPRKKWVGSTLLYCLGLIVLIKWV